MSEFGLYIHVPYCKSVCPYCDFNVVPNRAEGTTQWEDFFRALTHEWDSRRALFKGRLRTIYWGGGTPSLAPCEKIATFMDHVRDTVEVSEGLEISLEADPGTVTLQYLQGLRAAGVNRLSLGWQSNDDGLLKVIGRGHRSRENREVLELARQAGFENISVDFMFGIPGQTMGALQKNLAEVVDLAPEHVSLYALTYHEGTPFEAWRRSGRVRPVEHDVEAEMMERIERALVEAGYEHYEVSNFGRPGFRSKHNHAYWTGVPYLGVGPGANSFLPGERRRWEGIRKPRAYGEYWGELKETRLPEAGDESCEWAETLAPKQLISEQLMVGLRTSDGVDLGRFELEEREGEIEGAVVEALERGWVRREGEKIVPTPLGMRFADSLAELFF
ncbi:MAG: radical SAM family heme chaperone HemW [Myxococcota bacterium]|nr:radical SAM family heme chaperone HemW [Myxococcota bacterium]